MKGAIASGHRLTSEAGCEMLEKGGNAFDAVVAAGFTSIVAEPTLTSLAGGGFLLIHEQKSHCDRLIDFFVNTPGIGCKNISTPPLMPVDVRFKSTIQRFHIGIGSVAIPGTLKGLIHCYENFCSMDIGDLIKPALRCLKDGVEVTETMAYLFHILDSLMTYEDYGREIYKLKVGDRLPTNGYRKRIHLRTGPSIGSSIKGTALSRATTSQTMKCSTVTLLLFLTVAIRS
jgi:gamma-glutamyltranspeptidase/glutathione hydrolase